MTGNAVAEQGSALPALKATPAFEVDAQDIVIPRLYVAHYSSASVQEERVKAGDLYLAEGKDDPNPEILWSRKKTEKQDPGVIVHVLGMTKAKSDDSSGDLETYDFNDPTAPPTAWTTYNYVIALPEVPMDFPVPVKWLLTKSAQPTAKSINTAIMKAAPKPPWALAFEVITEPRENTKGKWFVPKVTIVEAKAENVDAAVLLAEIAAGPASSSIEKSSGDEPAI